MSRSVPGKIRARESVTKLKTNEKNFDDTHRPIEVRGVWSKLKDPRTNALYFENCQTRITTWDPPPKWENLTKNEVEKQGIWTKMYDPESGEFYFENTEKFTTVWEQPDEWNEQLTQNEKSEIHTPVKAKVKKNSSHSKAYEQKENNESITIDHGFTSFETAQWNVIFLHLFAKINNQVKAGIHVCRRVSKYFSRMCEVHRTFITDAEARCKHEDSMRATLRSEDEVFGYTESFINVQEVMRAFIRSHQAFVENLKKQCIEPLNGFHLTAETERTRLENLHVKYAKKIQQAFSDLRQQRAVCMKAWDMLLEIEHESRSGRVSDDAIKLKKKNDRQRATTQSAFIYFEKLKKKVIREQKEYKKKVAPLIESMQTLEMQRLATLQACFHSFSGVSDKFCQQPQKETHFLHDSLQPPQPNKSLGETTEKWFRIHGACKWEVDIELPCSSEELDLSKWESFVEGIEGMDKYGEGIFSDSEVEDEGDEKKKLPPVESREHVKHGLLNRVREKAAQVKDHVSVLDPIRQQVSLKKRRFQKDGFDLDLTYIMPRIIAMGIPSDKVSGLYRNHIHDVQRFFSTRHPNKYQLYNLCSELSYDAAKFDGRVVRYPFDDHNPCALKMILPFCRECAKFLDADPENIVAIHCKAGKGRSGMLIACLLYYLRVEGSADGCLRFFAVKRTKDGKGVTIPSQIRYVRYFAKLLDEEELSTELRTIPESRPLLLILLTLHGMPLKDDPKKIWFDIQLQDRDGKGKRKTLFSSKDAGLIPIISPAFDYIQFASKGLGMILINHDIRVQFYGGLNDKKLIHFWFNTRFLNNRYNDGSGIKDRLSLTLPKSEIDGLSGRKDRNHEAFNQDFKVTVVCDNPTNEQMKKYYSKPHNIHSSDSKSSTSTKLTKKMTEF